jgi:hypothetical protein
MSHCDAAQAAVDDVAENGPFWLKSMLDEDRVASVKRWVGAAAAAVANDDDDDDGIAVVVTILTRCYVAGF